MTTAIEIYEVLPNISRVLEEELTKRLKAAGLGPISAAYFVPAFEYFVETVKECHKKFPEIVAAKKLTLTSDLQEVEEELGKMTGSETHIILLLDTTAEDYVKQITIPLK